MQKSLSLLSIIEIATTEPLFFFLTSCSIVAFQIWYFSATSRLDTMKSRLHALIQLRFLSSATNSPPRKTSILLKLYGSWITSAAAFTSITRLSETLDTYAASLTGTGSDLSETPDGKGKTQEIGDHPVNAVGVFRNWGCSDSDISKMFDRLPSLRKAFPECLQNKLNLLSSLGITASDLVKIIHCRPRFLRYGIDRGFHERVEYLLGLFKTKEVLRKAILRNPSLLTYSFHEQIKPVINMYEELGIVGNDLVLMLLSRPTLIPRTCLDDEKLDYISRTGLSKDSKMYKYVVTLIAISRIETIREKLANIEKFGFSDEEVLGLVGRSPLLLTLSTDKVQRNMTFLCGTMKLSAGVILKKPFLLLHNLEAVLKPRFRLAEKIKDMRLVPQIEGPRMLTAMRMAEQRFIKTFIDCHPKDVAEQLMEFYTNAKCVKRLAESSKKSIHKGFPF